MQSRTLSSSDIKELKQYTENEFVEPMRFQDADMVRHVSFEEGVVTGEGEPWLVKNGDEYFPHLKYLLEHNVLPTVTIDMGGVKPISGGADVMAPGVSAVDDEVRKGRYVSVVDVDNNVPITVGKALFDAAEMRDKKGGRVVENVHHVSDTYWEM
jgi:PUA domain protein